MINYWKGGPSKSDVNGSLCILEKATGIGILPFIKKKWYYALIILPISSVLIKTSFFGLICMIFYMIWVRDNCQHVWLMVWVNVVVDLNMVFKQILFSIRFFF